MVGKIATFMVVVSARISQVPVLESRHPRTIGATTYLVWNNLLTS
jgi:hypothetical protein